MKTSQTSLIRSSVLSGAASIVPVPFLDDLLLKKIRKGLVHRVLKDNGISTDPDTFRTYFAGESKGCLATAFGLIFSLIRKVLKKLLRTVFFVFAVRASGVEMMQTYLIGRTLDRKIEEGLITGETSGEALSRPMRAAFKEAMSGSDRRIFLQTMQQVWRTVASDRGAVRSLIRRLRTNENSGDSDEIAPGDLEPAEKEVLEKSRSVFERSLENPDVQTFLHEFDRRFDASLSNQIDLRDESDL